MASKHEEELKKIGLRISYFRKLRGMSQLEVAEKIGCSRTHYSNIEATNMPTKLSLNTLLDIADALSISPDLLLKFENIDNE